MAKSAARPLTAGGRTLSRMGRNKGSGHNAGGMKGVWFQLEGKKYGAQAKLGSHQVGDPRRQVRVR